MYFTSECSTSMCKLPPYATLQSVFCLCELQAHVYFISVHSTSVCILPLLHSISVNVFYLYVPYFFCLFYLCVLYFWVYFTSMYSTYLCIFHAPLIQWHLLVWGHVMRNDPMMRLVPFCFFLYFLYIFFYTNLLSAQWQAKKSQMNSTIQQYP